MITIDYQSKLPLYEQIAGRFQTLILQGVLPPGSRMPSVRSLAVELSINPNTIQKAYTRMEQQGLIYSVRGRGNFVADSSCLAQKQRDTLMQQLSSLLTRCIDTGITRSECISLVDTLYQKEDSHDRTEKH